MKFLFNQLRQNSSSLDPNGQELAKSHIRILNADQTDRWDYDDHKRFFIKTLKRGWSVNPDPLERSAMFRRRHQILRQRLARTGLGVHFMSHENTEITFNSLITVRQAKSLPLNMSCAIFGMLSIIREDELFIEDLDDFIKITVDRSICDDSGLFYSEGCFVIIYGLVVSSGVVQVLKITQPPMEPRQLTLQTASHPDLFDSLNTSRVFFTLKYT